MPSQDSKKTMNSIILFIVIIVVNFPFYVNPSHTDLCNFHGTLFETETFYLTQPYSHNISIDLENYQIAFQTFPQKLSTFSNLFSKYATETEILAQEPLPLIPFTEDLNVFKTPSKSNGKKSFTECAKNNGSLLSLTIANRAKTIEIMIQLELPKIPFTSLPFQNVLSYPGLELLDDEPDHDTLEAVWSKTPVFIKNDNTFDYPTKDRRKRESAAASAADPAPESSAPKNKSDTPKAATEAAPAAAAETAPAASAPAASGTPLESQLFHSLCTKPNNPWDRESLRKNWLKLVPQIKTAIRFLQELGHTYTQTANTLHKLPKSPISEIAKSIKLILPEPLKAILDFLDNFSSKRQWESTSPRSLTLFSNFVKDTFKAIKLFNLDSSITNIKTRPKKRFRLLNFNDLHWKDFFDLDEELYGISGPISVTPFDQHPLSSHNTFFTANVRFRIFHRHNDKCTIYKFKPNIFDHQIADIKNILKTSKYSLASKEDFIPHDCHSQQTELHRICHKLPSHAYEPKQHLQMTECGSAMFSQTYDKKSSFCPLTSPPSDPIIYRADCQHDDHSSLIVSSTHPITLAFVCDSKFDKNVNLTVFPSKIHTDCEARLLDSSDLGLVVPQRNPDLLQDPVLGPIFPFLQPTVIKPPFNYVFYVVIPVASGIFLLFIAILTFCLCKHCKKPQSNLGPPVRSGTFRVISTNPSLIELRTLDPDRANIGFRNNEYPLLN